MYPYKKKGFYLTKEDYLENTFGLDDIYGPKTIRKFRNASSFKLKEMKTLFNGRVFVVCPLHQFAEYKRLIINLVKDTEFEFSVFKQDEEFWFTLSRFPMRTSVTKINTVTMLSADVSIAELDEKYLSKDLDTCNDYENTEYDGFVQCAKNKLRDYLRSTLQCMLPGFEVIFGEVFGKY
jgi:hypothetical protein